MSIFIWEGFVLGEIIIKIGFFGIVFFISFLRFKVGGDNFFIFEDDNNNNLMVVLGLIKNCGIKFNLIFFS